MSLIMIYRRRNKSNYFPKLLVMLENIVNEWAPRHQAYTALAVTLKSYTQHNGTQHNNYNTQQPGIDV
jgi:hypothetical protein